MSDSSPGPATRQPVPWLIRGLAAHIRKMRMLLRTAWIKTTYPNVSMHWSARVDSSTQLRVTDGGRLMIGPGAFIACHCEIVVQGGVIAIGPRSFIGRGSTITAKESVRLGSDVLVAEYVTIRDQQHRIDSLEAVANAGYVTAPIVIGDDVWIGAKASVFLGSSIGDHAVIGAHSMVKGDVPAAAVAIGTPARVLRYRERKSCSGK
jgi:acetyltransferase-like isoleucine patch superfamily enzyme